jgi:transaldolase
MPEATIAAFSDHGTVARTVDAEVDDARATIAAVEQAGVSMAEVTRNLELDGVAAFAASFESLLETIKGRLDEIGRSAA